MRGAAGRRAAAHPPLLAVLVLSLVLLGAGSKAGIVPLHVWLPLAHPAAPSHVSALMSGVMTKVAVYGFIRIVFDLLGLSTWWASMVVLVFGAATAVLIFLMFFVIPRFSQIYADANVRLPLLTRMLISTVDGLTHGLPVLLPLTLASIAAAVFFVRSERGRYHLDRLKLRLPFFARLLVDYSLTGFCSTFGTTLSSGIPAVRAMQMSRGTLNNLVLEHRINHSILRVEEMSTG